MFNIESFIQAKKARKKAQRTGGGCVQASLMEVAARAGRHVPTREELDSWIPSEYLDGDGGGQI